MQDQTIRAEVIRMLAQVALPPGEPLPRGAPEPLIADWELRNQIRLPPEFRAWLAACNGPCVGPGGVTGIATKRNSQDVDFLLRLHPDWHKQGWVPLAGDGSGNYYVVATKGEFGPGEPVLFIDNMIEENVPAFVVASDSWQFLWFMLKKELGQSKWPFDRAEVVSEDPAILTFSSVCLPWESSV